VSPGKEALPFFENKVPGKRYRLPFSSAQKYIYKRSVHGRIKLL